MTTAQSSGEEEEGRRRADRSPNNTARDTIDGLNRWLHTVGVGFRDQESFVDAYCQELRRFGITVERVWVSALVLHPLVAARAWKWESTGKIQEFSWTRTEFRSFQSSLRELGYDEDNERRNAPMYQIVKGAPSVSIKSTDEKIPEDCDWFLKENYTELYGLPTPGTRLMQQIPDGTVWDLEETGRGQLEGGFTWSTKAPGGFTRDQIEVLDETVFALSTVIHLYITRFTSKTLLMAYLGEDAGTRVHGGAIDRGEGLTIRSAIWFSDIRNFTRMSAELPRREIVDLINSVFEVTHAVVRKHKGQVLKYMGDGCMAIFTKTSFQRLSFSSEERNQVDEDHGAQVCHNARLAAAELQHALRELAAERESRGLRGASVGIGLHYGDVSYGNVGSAERLDFTVLGPHVNLASRTESLCKDLKASVLATSDFVRLDEGGEDGSWESRGDHQVKGVAEPVSIFELKDDHIIGGDGQSNES